MTEAIPLRQYVDTKFEAQEKAVSAALAAAEKAVASALAAADRAVAKAEAASDKRFEGVNEFRQSLADQSRLLMPRAEFEQVIKAQNEKLEQLTGRVNSRDDQGKGRSDVVGWLFGGVSLLVAIGVAVFK